jgi:hypothetical protein
MTDPASGAAGRSGFVTALAWIFIALAGFATLISILQNIMIALMFPVDEMRTAMRESEKARPMPAGFRFMFDYFHYFFLAFLVVSVATLVSAIGLLLRKNWARLIFIGMMGIAILWNLASLAMPLLMTSLMPEMGGKAPEEFMNNFKLMWNIMIGFSVLMALAFAALFGWIIKRLTSAEIRREFLDGNQA